MYRYGATKQIFNEEEKKLIVEARRLAAQQYWEPASEKYWQAGIRGNAAVMRALGEIYQEGRLPWLSREDASQRANLCFAAARTDNPLEEVKRQALRQRKSVAEWFLGSSYLIGWVPDYPKGSSIANKKAQALYEQAAKQGDAAAQCSLGWMYQQGLVAGYRPFRQPNKKAQALYEQAARQGYAAAQSNLGWLYQQGLINGYPKGSDKANKKAQELYEQAASQGFAVAQNSLGEMYQQGLIDGCPPIVVLLSGASREKSTRVV